MISNVSRNYKPSKTAADYMAIAACPALIMTLIGSLVLMLLEASYSGPWLGSMRWTLCWFAFAIVLVARIAIERNRTAALGYGAMLAAATSLFLVSHFGFILPVWLLLGAIWWTADRLVWDCTLINEDIDSSGVGLLQGGKIERLTSSKASLLKISGAPKPPERNRGALRREQHWPLDCDKPCRCRN